MLQLRLSVLILFTLIVIQSQVTRGMPTTSPGGQEDGEAQTEIPTKTTTTMHTSNTPSTTMHTDNTVETSTPTTGTTTSHPPTTSPPPTTTMPNTGCFQDGKWYLPGQDISRGFDGKNWCYGTWCDESGQIVVWDNFNCATTTSHPPTTSPPPTTIPNTTPPGCFHDGKWYLPGKEISRGFDGKNWCYGSRCDESGQIIAWDNFNCATTTTHPSTTTPPWTTIPNTSPPGCFQDGKWYLPGQEISRGFDGKNWCYGSRCDESGHILVWDSFNCGTTTPSPPTTIPNRHGCFHDGKWYEPGQEISRVIDVTGCHGTNCDHLGNIVAWDDWNCITTTPQTTTTPSPPTTEIPDITPTTRHGCLYEGKWYRPGQEISRGFDGKNWCYGTYCDKSGHVAAWDNWKCGTTTAASTPPPSTAPPSIAPPPGCFHHGQVYAPYSIILESTNGNGWCYGKRCTDDGQLILWDDFACQKPKVTPGCDYGGHLYKTGTELFRKNSSGCFGGVCERNGRIKAWTKLDCQKENLFHGGRLKPSWCKHGGVVYPRGSVFDVKPLFKRFGFGWCRGAKCVANGRIVAWGPKWAPGYC